MLFALDPDENILVLAMETEDELGRILRVHFEVERQMSALIQSKTTAIVDAKSSFYSKLNLMRAMNASAKVIGACEAMNMLRNEFAHNHKATVANTKDISNKFIGAVETFMPALKRSHGTWSRKKTGFKKDYDFSTLSQSEKIVIAASFLSAALGTLPKTHLLPGGQEIMQIKGFIP